MKKYIHVTKEDRAFLVKVFGVTPKMVQCALHYDVRRGGSELAKKIRKCALERGGTVMAVSPEVETLHDADGYMRQYFGVMDISCAIFEWFVRIGHFVCWSRRSVLQGV